MKAYIPPETSIPPGPAVLRRLLRPQLQPACAARARRAAPPPTTKEELWTKNALVFSIVVQEQVSK